MYHSHPSFAHVLVADRRRELQRQADASRLRREAKRQRRSQ